MTRALLPGERFGLLTVLEKAWETRRGRYVDTYYRLTCDCGEAHCATGANLLRANTKSCGCLRSGGRAAVAKQMDTQLQKTITRHSDLIAQDTRDTFLSPKADAA